MAGQFSFDIVSEVDLQEVRNAVDQAAREISQRFDFKGTGTSVALENEKIELAAGTEDRLKAAWQVLQEKAVRRQVPLKSLHAGEIQQAAKGTVRQSVDVIQGIPDEKAKQISKFVRGTVPKAQTQIQGSSGKRTSGWPCSSRTIADPGGDRTQAAVLREHWPPCRFPRPSGGGHWISDGSRRARRRSPSASALTC